MGGQKSMEAIFVVMMMVASFHLQSTEAKTRHIVGDALGWTIPPAGPSTYTTWASQQTFTVGDTLLFNFTTGIHNVAEVSQPAATTDPCTSTNTLSINPTSPVTVKLTRPGTHQYICTAIGHCQIGQKLTIKVSPSSTIAFPLSASPTTSPIPSPQSGSPSLATIIPVTFFATAFAFFY